MPDKPDRFDALLDAMLTKPGPDEEPAEAEDSGSEKTRPPRANGEL